MTFSTCLLGLVALLAQDPLPGIDRDMARARAERVGNVSYRLQFSLVPGSGEVTGSAEVRFTLPGKSGPQPDLVLDFAGRAIEDIRVNEREPLPPLTVRNGHVVLPGAMLQTGENRFRAKVRADAAPTGAPVTVYRDPTDGSEYWYTLVVPADAHRLYPCFDQPDVKARFQLLLEVPAAWRSVANGATVHEELVDTDRKLVRFVPTLPISTYLMAFAAGPFAVADGPRLEGPGFEAKPVPRLYQRPSQQQHTDEDLLFRMHADGLRWMTQCFGVPYPFRKLDIVLLPGFPYGGMEHAGAIFYRESALSFDHPPTESELVRRSTLVHHEIAHQWFGNLVTMRWFDDLWLKEGFATFLGYQCMEELEPQRRSWLRFLQRVKPRAYEVDGTAGTVPVYQSLQNLADAKSAYGPIVYNKAPAVLRELHERLGKEAFREGLSAFLQQHAFGAAEWQDLADALGKAGSTNLSRWSERWLLSPSMPQVRVVLETDAQGTVTSARVEQQSTGAEGTWPLALEVRWLDREGTWHTGRVAGEASTIALPALVGRPMPWCVLPNPGDVAYGQFVPDPASRTWLLANVAQEPDPLVRAVALQALLESVRECELDPQALAAVALDLLAMETDAENHAWLLDTLGSCLLRWQPRDRAAEQLQRATALLLGQLSKGAPGRELQSFRFLARASAAPDVLALCRRVARNEDLPAGLVPGKADRFLALAALFAAGAEQGELEALERSLAGQDLGKERYLALAARPGAAAKEQVFEGYLQLAEPPEQWIADSLVFFHWPGQQDDTLPFLQRALEKAVWTKENRRIFFMPAWLDGFVQAHASAEALTVVEAFARTELPADVRNKLLQSLDGLRRAVRIRARWQ